MDRSRVSYVKLVRKNIANKEQQMYKYWSRNVSSMFKEVSDARAEFEAEKATGDVLES